MAWFRKQKRKASLDAPAGEGRAVCPCCKQATFTLVNEALPREAGKEEREKMGDLVDDKTGYCSKCGLVAWGEAYASGGNEEERARRALLNNTLLLSWTRECRERHARGEPTTKQHEVDFLNGARRAFGSELDHSNHKRFVAICLESAAKRLRRR